jgi:hypothetical protein
MAKAQKKVQEQEINEQGLPLTEEDRQAELEVIKEYEAEQPELDASGRKKKVAISMEELETKGLKNKSQVIRYLDGEGYSRSAIALFLNIRYQHVRNVLTTQLKKG